MSRRSRQNVPSYLTAKLSASTLEVTGTRFGVCRLESSPIGGSAYHVLDPDILPQILGPRTGGKYSEFLYTLSNDPPSDPKTINAAQELYRALIGPEIVQRLTELKGRAGNKDTIRLAIAADEAFGAIPWEFLHDGTDYLLRRGYSIVRVEDRLPTGTAYFGPLRRLAVLVANPKDDGLDEFNPNAHLDQLKAALDSAKVDLVQYYPATRACVQELFEKDDTFDGLYFLGHGRAGELILESDVGEPDRLDPGDIVAWMRGWDDKDRQLSLIYLAACSSGETNDDGALFSGVAHRLMSSDRVGTAIAMQAPINPGKAMTLAGNFFEKFLRRRDPEQALLSARISLSDQFSRATPVLYTHMEGFTHFRRNRAAALLSLPLEGTAALSLPPLRLGLPETAYSSRSPDLLEILEASGEYYYRGPTYARLDVEAAKEVLDLLAIVVTPDKILWHVSEEADLVLSIGAHHTMSLLHEYSTRFRLKFLKTKWKIVDTRTKTEYSIPSPLSTKVDYYAEDDYALIEKVRIPEPRRTAFFVCGLGDRATRGAAWYLARQWETLLAQHNDGPFWVLLKFPGGLSHDYAKMIDWGSA